MMPEKPQNPFFLLLLAVSVAWMVPLACIYYAFPEVPVIRAATLTFGVVFGLMLLTSWSAKRGYDLSFLAPLLSPCLVAILVWVLIEFFVPQWRTSVPLCNGFTALVSCGYIISFSSYLMQHSNFEDNITVAISVLSCSLGLFFSLFNLVFRLT